MAAVLRGGGSSGPRWGPMCEAIILRRGDQFYLKLRPGTDCTFDLAGTEPDPTNRQERVADMSQPLQSIAFDRLSGEMEIGYDGNGFYRVAALGLPGAVCQLDRGNRHCYDRLETALMKDQ